MDMNTCAVIMAGGRGERFWPLSRNNRPKQFLPLVHDEKTMIQQTVERILPLIAMEDMLVVTNERYKTLTRQQLPTLCEENILCEPAAKNTAPCIGLAAMTLRRRVGDCVMAVLASDHLIVDEEAFRRVLATAISMAAAGENILTIGIPPAYPETGFGYVHFDAGREVAPGVHAVHGFVEKPDPDTAQAYVQSGEYLWNSGMFVFRASTILKQIERHMPTLYQGLLNIEAAMDTDAYETVLRESFESFDAVSIDYGVMEHAENIFTVPGNFGWDDVGSFAAAGRIREKDENGNALVGDVLAIKSEGCTVYAGAKRLVTTLGVSDLVVVDTDDVVMVCKKDEVQQVKALVEALRAARRYELL
jgi:mannose-1-phosphate guanylyltransferase